MDGFVEEMNGHDRSRQQASPSSIVRAGDEVWSESGDGIWHIDNIEKEATEHRAQSRPNLNKRG